MYTHEELKHFVDKRRIEELELFEYALSLSKYADGLAVPVFTAFFLCNASFLKSAKAACIFSRRSAGKPVVFFVRLIY